MLENFSLGDFTYILLLILIEMLLLKEYFCC